MDYQVILNDVNIATPVMNEHDKNVYIEMLDKNEIKYTVFERAARKWQLAKVVFDMQLIPAAKKAVSQNRDMKGLYTFGDPNKAAKQDSAVVVECTTAEKKVAYVVGIWHATETEIKQLKDKIGYPKLGLVVGQA